MKTFTYVAAIALLTAGTAFAQSSGNDASSMKNTPAPAQSQSTINHSPSMSDQSMSGSAMDKGAMDKDMTAPASKQASQPNERRHIASTGSHANRSADARENQITAQLNRAQLNSGGTMPQQAQSPAINAAPQQPMSSSPGR